MQTCRIEMEIYNTFADIASTVGYSDVNGRILAVLLVAGRPLSMQEIADRIGVSLSNVSVSLDLLEFLGMVKKIRQAGDRRVYAELQGSLLDGLKRAIAVRLQKSIDNSLTKFTNYRKELNGKRGAESEKVLKSLNILEKEIKRLNGYLAVLQKARL